MQVNQNEERTREITRKLIFDGHFEMNENELLYEIIKLNKCDLNTAKTVLQKMKDLGMEVCYTGRIGYSIRKFANMRGYVTEEEFTKLDKEMLDQMKKENEHEAKFIEKYGADKSKWSDDVWDEYEFGDD